MSKPQRNADDRLTRWIHDHGRALRGYLQAMTLCGHAAEDLLQEVFCRAWSAQDQYQATGNERAYLFTIADRLLIDRTRRAGREVVLDDTAWQQLEPAHDSLPESDITHEEARRALHEALEQLTNSQQRVLLLRYFSGLKFAEIAEIMECPLSTVLSHGRRGLLTLRKLLVETPL